MEIEGLHFRLCRAGQSRRPFFVARHKSPLITLDGGLLDVAQRAGAATESPLNVEGVDIGLSAAEIVDIVREIRER